jgi:hypothetical protein
MLNVVMLNVIMLNDIMLNVIMLNVIMLNVIMLNVVAPIYGHAELNFRIFCLRRCQFQDSSISVQFLFPANDQPIFHIKFCWQRCKTFLTGLKDIK